VEGLSQGVTGGAATGVFLPEIALKPAVVRILYRMAGEKKPS
jgi:hypothetical protein